VEPERQRLFPAIDVDLRNVKPSRSLVLSLDASPRESGTQAASIVCLFTALFPPVVACPTRAGDRKASIRIRFPAGRQQPSESQETSPIILKIKRARSDGLTLDAAAAGTAKHALLRF
jgi:hypothetical protein